MAMWTFAAVLLLSYFCGAAAAEDCTNVTCEKGFARLVMDKSVLERRKDCDHGLYNEEKRYVHSANASGVMDYWCLPKMYWKIVCDEDRTMNFEACFRGVNNSGHGSTPESHVRSNNQAWKIVIPVVLGLVLGVVVIGLVIIGWRMWRKRRGGSQPNITFSEVANEEPV